MSADELDAVLALAAEHERRGDVAAAIGALESVGKLHRARGLWNYARGALAARSGALSAAVQHFEAAVEAEPEIAEYRSNLGAVLLELARAGDTSAAARALEVLRAAVRWGPSLPDVFANYALALLLANRPEEALHACDDALRLDGAHLPARFNRAAVLSALGRSDDALGELERLIADNPHRDDLRDARARLAAKVERR